MALWFFVNMLEKSSLFSLNFVPDTVLNRRTLGVLSTRPHAYKHNIAGQVSICSQLGPLGEPQKRSALCMHS